MITVETNPYDIGPTNSNATITGYPQHFLTKFQGIFRIFLGKKYKISGQNTKTLSMITIKRTTNVEKCKVFDHSCLYRCKNWLILKSQINNRATINQKKYDMKETLHIKQSFFQQWKTWKKQKENFRSKSISFLITFLYTGILDYYGIYLWY